LVEKLAADTTLDPDTYYVREAAKACLPAIMQNADAERQRNTLLRAAVPFTESEVSLLRPAVSVPETSDAQLLRPAE
jgi:hypothetical protein